MVNDGDRHQLGDPISRIADDDTGIQWVLTDRTDPAWLTEEQLRCQRADLDRIMREADTPPSLTQRAEIRLRQLSIEHRRRAAITYP